MAASTPAPLVSAFPADAGVADPLEPVELTWSPAGNLLAVFQVCACAATPSGDQGDCPLTVWNRRSAKLARSLRLPCGKSFFRVGWSRNEDFVFAQSDGFHAAWSLPDGSGNLPEGWIIDTSPDGDTVLLTNDEGDVLLWRRSTKKLLREVPGAALSEDFQGTLEWSPTGKLILVAMRSSPEDPLEIWNGKTGVTLRKVTLPPQIDPAQRLSYLWRSDGEQVLLWQDSGLLATLTLGSGKLQVLRPSRQGSHAGQAFVSDTGSDGFVVHDADGRLSRGDWNVGVTRQLLPPVAARWNSPVWLTPDKNSAALLAEEGGALVLLALDAPEKKATLPLGEQGSFLGFGADGRAYVRRGPRVLGVGIDGVQVAEHLLPSGSQAVSLSPDGKVVAVAGVDVTLIGLADDVRVMLGGVQQPARD